MNELQDGENNRGGKVNILNTPANCRYASRYETVKMYENISVHEGLKSHDANDRSHTREPARLSENFYTRVCVPNRIDDKSSLFLSLRRCISGEKGCIESLLRLPGANLILCCRAARNTRYSLQVYRVSALTCAG